MDKHINASAYKFIIIEKILENAINLNKSSVRAFCTILIQKRFYFYDLQKKNRSILFIYYIHNSFMRIRVQVKIFVSLVHRFWCII